VIFVTVGTQLSFDRLLAVLDAWAPTQQDGVVAQVGPSQLKFQHIDARPFLRADEMDQLFARCTLVIAHAGMGSILSALRFRKPIIIVPRKAALGEHRNDHQMATARWMDGRPGVKVAWEPEQVETLAQSHRQTQIGETLPEFADAAFTQRIRRFLDLG